MDSSGPISFRVALLRQIQKRRASSWKCGRLGRRLGQRCATSGRRDRTEEVTFDCLPHTSCIRALADASGLLELDSRERTSGTGRPADLLTDKGEAGEQNDPCGRLWNRRSGRGEFVRVCDRSAAL
jgi:hypothetical protein